MLRKRKLYLNLWIQIWSNFRNLTISTLSLYSIFKLITKNFQSFKTFLLHHLFGRSDCIKYFSSSIFDFGGDIHDRVSSLCPSPVLLSMVKLEVTKVNGPNDKTLSCC